VEINTYKKSGTFWVIAATDAGRVVMISSEKEPAFYTRIFSGLRSHRLNISFAFNQ
jgi:hypothetical protein